MSLLASAGLVSLPVRAFAEVALTLIDNLKPGQFTWNPEKAPAGHVVVVVSLPDQRVYVYRHGIRIAVSTCSTGKQGHGTPTGVFAILQKDKNHRSSTYNNAPMPNMNRLTWSGVALHAGQLPGYPASHGCVRLPHQFSEKLFSITAIGTPVIIANAATYPNLVTHPGMILSKTPRRDFKPVARSANKTSKRVAVAPAGKAANTSIVISGAEQKIIVIDDGVLVAEGTMTFTEPQRALGNHVFILSSVNSANQELQWRTIGYYNDSNRELEMTELATLQRLQGDNVILDKVRERMKPGTVLVMVDTPLTADSRTTKEFVIMATDDDV